MVIINIKIFRCEKFVIIKYNIELFKNLVTSIVVISLLETLWKLQFRTSYEFVINNDVIIN